jgi:hypothetical protein
MPACGADTIDGLPMTGCGHLSKADWYWNPKKYFKARDAEWSGTVTIGMMKSLKEPSKNPMQKLGK